MRHVKTPGQHRAQPGRRRAQPPRGRRRAEVQPRYGRIAVFTASASVTAIALLGGFGVLPAGPEGANAASGVTGSSAIDDKPGRQADSDGVRKHDNRGQQLQVIPAMTVNRHSEPPAGDAPALPADSGTGRRVVFSESEQRVWLVDASGEVLRSYLVSGSATDNLDPGTYDVYSRSRWAVGIDDSGTMQYFVRFTEGDAGGAIGFHTIPVDDGAPVQTIDELGTPLSHGCIRQRTADAVALWDFSPIGTTVVVTA